MCKDQVVHIILYLMDMSQLRHQLGKFRFSLFICNAIFSKLFSSKRYGSPGAGAPVSSNSVLGRIPKNNTTSPTPAATAWTLRQVVYFVSCI